MPNDNGQIKFEIYELQEDQAPEVTIKQRRQAAGIEQPGSQAARRRQDTRRWGVRLKHTPGGVDHEQGRHGWRYGSVDAARRSVRGESRSEERAEYYARAGKHGVKITPEKYTPPPPKPTKSSRVAHVRSRLEAIEASAMYKEFSTLDADFRRNARKLEEARTKHKTSTDARERLKWAAEADQLTSKHYTMADRRQKLKEQLRAEYIKALAVDNPVTIKPAFDDVGWRKEDELTSALGEISQLISADKFPKEGRFSKRTPFVTIKGEPDVTRSFYFGGRHARIGMATKAGGDTLAHEMGHWFEDTAGAKNFEYGGKVVTGAGLAANEFLARRTAGEKYRSLRKLTGSASYSAMEKAKPDKFESPYVGKYYNDMATEVTSMGLGYLYTNPIRFMNRDPDYFAFMITQLQGE